MDSRTFKRIRHPDKQAETCHQRESKLLMDRKGREIILLSKKLMISRSKLEKLISRNGWWIRRIVSWINKKTFWKRVGRQIIVFFKIWRRMECIFRWLRHLKLLCYIMNKSNKQELGILNLQKKRDPLKVHI